MRFSKTNFFAKLTVIIITIIMISGLSACSFSENPDIEYKYPKKVMGRYTNDAKPQSERDTIFGKGGIDLFGNKANQSAGGIGVNSFLWRASLDTISFMPLTSADPFGGVIITDWYSPSSSPNERFKLNVFIMGKALRADGIKISAFRQVKSADGSWVDASVSENTASDLENTVLTRARELRISHVSSKK
jgi:hypothetical protein